MAIQGHVTWYDKCIGGAHDTGTGGACGGCKDGNNAMMAWPNLTTTGCNDHCGTNPGKACEVSLFVKSKCNSNSRYVRIKDCCPCASQGGCNVTPKCNGSPYTNSSYKRLIADLTTATFLALGGSMSDGRFPAEITV